MDKRRTLVLLAAALFLGLLGIQAALVEQWLAMHERRDSQAQFKQEVLRLERLVADVENGFRGYVLMRQSTFLGPMVSAEGRIPRVLERLDQLTAAQPDLKGRMQVLHARVTELLETKRRLTLDVERGEEEAVLAYIRGGEGLALANTIALAFQELDRRLEDRQRDWDRDNERRVQWVRWGLPVTAIGGVACGIGIGRTTGRSRAAMTAQMTRYA